MDIVTTIQYLYPDDIFTDEMGHRHQMTRVKVVDAGYYVYVVGQNYPEFYLRDHKITLRVPDTKFKPGDWVQARNGRGAVYMVNRVIPATQYSPERYEFDNGSVDVRKRARSGRHTVTRANHGYKLVK